MKVAGVQFLAFHRFAAPGRVNPTLCPASLPATELDGRWRVLVSVVWERKRGNFPKRHECQYRFTLWEGAIGHSRPLRPWRLFVASFAVKNFLRFISREVQRL